VVKLARNCLRYLRVEHLRNTLKHLAISHNPMVEFEHTPAKMEGFVELQQFEAGNCLFEFMSFVSCPRLSVLHVPHNLLVDLRVHDCPAITSLDCSNNDIMDLELHTCPRLVSLKGTANRIIALTTARGDMPMFKGQLTDRPHWCLKLASV
jgi:Leucine-rich repeat (LRR) protein